jgi:hypothetical protein
MGNRRQLFLAGVVAILRLVALNARLQNDLVDLVVQDFAAIAAVSDR